MPLYPTLLPSGRDPVVFVIDTDIPFREHVCKIAQTVGLQGVPLDNPNDFLNNAPTARSSCLVVNYRLPGMGGLALQKNLRERRWEIPLIMTTDLIGDVKIAVQVMKNGALDFVEKPIDEQTLLERIQVGIGQDEDKKKFQISKSAMRNELASLTPRELQILSHCMLGSVNKVTAHELGISVKTVEAHRASVARKLSAYSWVVLAGDPAFVAVWPEFIRSLYRHTNHVRAI